MQNTLLPTHIRRQLRVTASTVLSPTLHPTGSNGGLFFQFQFRKHLFLRAVRIVDVPISNTEFYIYHSFYVFY